MPAKNDIVPMGEKKVKPLTITVPRSLYERILRIAKETGNTKSETARRLIQFSLNDYEAASGGDSRSKAKKEQHLDTGAEATRSS